MEYTGFWKRLLAYLIDIIPITLLVASIVYFLFGFDEIWQRYRTNIHDLDAKAEFLSVRNMIRDISLVVWIVYCAIFESSKIQGTIGKRIIGAKVVAADGSRLSFGGSILRNVLKIVSALPLFLGFVWAAFSKQKQALHDVLAKSLVIQRSSWENEEIKHTG